MSEKRPDRDVEPDREQAHASEPEALPTGSAEKANTADLQSLIGRQLRAVYDDIAKQPVPDRFIELMQQLDTKSASG
jgi:hypothetical protein